MSAKLMDLVPRETQYPTTVFSSEAERYGNMLEDSLTRAEYINATQLGYEAYTSLLTDSIMYENMSDSDRQSYHRYAIENYKIALFKIGETDLSGLSYEDSNFEYSPEELDGERKGLIQRIGKSLSNLFTSHKVSGKAFKYEADVKTLLNYRDALKNNKVAEKEISDKTISSLKADLGIFYAMGGNGDSMQDIINHFEMPSKLFSNIDIFTLKIKRVYDTLKAAKITKSKIDIAKNTDNLKVLDKIKLPEIRKWISKTTFDGYIDRYMGNRLTVSTLMIMDDTKIRHRYDIFKIDDKFIQNKSIGNFSKEDMLKLIEMALKIDKEQDKIIETAKEIASDNRLVEIFDMSKQSVIALLSPIIGVALVSNTVRNVNSFTVSLNMLPYKAANDIMVMEEFVLKLLRAKYDIIK